MPTAVAWRASAPAPQVGDLGVSLVRLAHAALLRELRLTPKPGLVDRANSGAHHDMDLPMFRASAAAIAPWLAVFFQRGVAHNQLAPSAFLATLRADGLACERAMLRATQGVNTHKGSIFAFGLLCAAGGRLAGRGDVPDRESICAEVAALCSGLVSRELCRANNSQTAGERLYAQHGLTGARGEAQSGFATARSVGVPPYQLALALGLGEERALLEALLHLMARNPDTNLVARGGLAGLALVQNHAATCCWVPCRPPPSASVSCRRLTSC